MQNLISAFCGGLSISHLYSANSKLSGLIAIDGQILKQELAKNRETEIRFWKYMCAQLCFLMPEKFPILNSVSYPWVETLIKRCGEIEFLDPNTECDLETGAIMLTGKIYKNGAEKNPGQATKIKSSPSFSFAKGLTTSNIEAAVDPNSKEGITPLYATKDCWMTGEDQVIMLVASGELSVILDKMQNYHGEKIDMDELTSDTNKEKIRIQV
jgi:hypothetical protein